MGNWGITGWRLDLDHNGEPRIQFAEWPTDEHIAEAQHCWRALDQHEHADTPSVEV